MRRISVGEVIEFTRAFAVMTNARLPMIQALDTAAHAQRKGSRLRPILLEVIRRVQGGRSLSDALSEYPEAFDTLYVQLVRVGETAGVLDTVLLRLATYLEKSGALRRKVRLALVYPAVVLVVAVGAATFLLATVVPTFAGMFSDFGAKLPAPTRVVLSISHALTEHGLLWLAILLGSGLIVRSWLRTERGRRFKDRFVLRLPLIGPLLLKSLVARFCRTLGTLVESGVGLVDALSLLTRAAGNSRLEAEVEDMLARVSRGGSLAGGETGLTRERGPLQHRSVPLFPEMVIQMITVGERTARLDEMLLHIAAHYEGEVDGTVETLTSVIEPVLVVIIGLVLGAILIAMYLPMFDLVNVVG